MIFTLACIVCTSLLGVLFKWSEKYNASSAGIIPVNYLTCFIIGCLHGGGEMIDNLYKDWSVYSLVLGLLFFSGFTFFANGIRLAGLPRATMFQKMSIILSVSYAVLMGDKLNMFQLAGLLCGLSAIILICSNNTSKFRKEFAYFGFLIGTLVLSAAIEIIFIYINNEFYLDQDSKLILPSYIFLTAGILGVLYYWIKNKSFVLKKSEWIFGILIGVPNFYSIYFLLLVLDGELKSSVFFPALNCSVIAISAIVAVCIFREKLNMKQSIGILLSMISIFLIIYFKS